MRILVVDDELDVQTLFEQRFGAARPFGQAEICAALGRKSEALAWLRRAIAARDPALQHLRTSPLLAPIRSEPEYHAFERQLNFPPLLPAQAS